MFRIRKSKYLKSECFITHFVGEYLLRIIQILYDRYEYALARIMNHQ